MMKVIADTNFLLRFILLDNPQQLAAAYRLLEACVELVIPTHVLCEIAWVLGAKYKLNRARVLSALDYILTSEGVNFRKDEVEAGLELLRRGGDFADGVNAYAGRMMTTGTPVFASFDRQAVRLLTEQGIAAIIPE